MIQKLENFYLATLRFVVILVATLLLIGVVLLGIRSFDGLSSPPKPVELKPSVSQADLKSAILKSAQGDITPDTVATASSDPNQGYYNRVGTAIKRFADKQYPGVYTIDPSRIATMVKEKADTYPSADLTAAYAKNLAENVDALLADPQLVAHARKNELGPVVDRMFNAFAEEFDRQVKETNDRNEELQAEYLSRKAEAQQNLYVAAGTFGVFLLIVFLSIIIRIERNLRPQASAA
jgi:hypothetical protein